jgi:toxin ParE1/3/4
MVAQALKDLMRRIEAWPEAAQDELAEVALEIEAELERGIYQATQEELAGIDRGLNAARQGRFCNRSGRGVDFRETPTRMKVAFTEEALRDLDEILKYIAANYPTISTSFEKRLRAVLARVGAWPESAQGVADRPGVRVVPLIRYPYKSSTASAIKQWRYCTSTMLRASSRGKGSADRIAIGQRPTIDAGCRARFRLQRT